MAFVINPDGTIKILEVKYDRSGNISPKRIIEGYENTALQQSHRDTEWHGGDLCPADIAEMAEILEQREQYESTQELPSRDSIR